MHTRRLPYFFLLIPFMVAELLALWPVASYLAAWLGSWVLLYMVLSGTIKPLPGDRPLRAQILRPFMMTQLIFVGYTCLSSFPHFLDKTGFLFAQAAADPEQLARVAAAQRFYVLAHGGFALGLLWATDYRRSGEWRIRSRIEMPVFLLGLGVGAAFLGRAAMQVGGAGQFADRLLMTGLVASVLALALNLGTRNVGMLAVSAVVYLLNLGNALLSGWKEQVLVVILLLAVFAFPRYRRTVVLVTPVVLAVALIFLPSYTFFFRSANWKGKADASTAATLAYQQMTSKSSKVASLNQEFVTSRVSEIGMFTTYLRFTPATHGYYGLLIPKQAVYSLIPRVAWPEKPVTEKLVMARALENRVVSRYSEVSAKPQFVVDGYLSAGAVGVLLSCILYGYLASLASVLCERWFGGYLIGSGLVYTSMFNVFWRGNSFEFFLNTVLWSFVLTFAVFMGARANGWLVRAAPSESGAPPREPASKGGGAGARSSVALPVRAAARASGAYRG